MPKADFAMLASDHPFTLLNGAHQIAVGAGRDRIIDDDIGATAVRIFSGIGLRDLPAEEYNMGTFSRGIRGLFVRRSCRERAITPSGDVRASILTGGAFPHDEWRCSTRLCAPSRVAARPSEHSIVSAFLASRMTTDMLYGFAMTEPIQTSRELEFLPHYRRPSVLLASARHTGG